jgi:hypothetical protein
MAAALKLKQEFKCSFMKQRKDGKLLNSGIDSIQLPKKRE